MNCEHLDSFWTRARTALERGTADGSGARWSAPVEPPEAWAFGATPQQADDLLDLVLAGIKTGTASALGDYEAEEPLPAVGDLSILLDGTGTARAVSVVTEVAVMPFDEVTAEHARAEGEGDRSLEAWRSIHEEFWREHSVQGLALDMPVVCERFEVLYSETPPPGGTV